MSRDQALMTRMRRLERLERAARMWVNGEELGGRGRYGHLSDSYD
jgi:hypothetical protein